MAKLTHWLKKRCRLQRLASGVSAFLATLALADILALALWGLDKIAPPIQENIYKYLITSILIILSTLFLWLLLRCRGSFAAKVRDYGREHPEEHDALEAAVELEAKAQRGELRPFEQEYLAQLQQQYAADDFARLRDARTFAQPRWWPQLATAVFLLLLFLYNIGNPVLQRAWRSLASRPGIEFVALPAEVARHHDLTAEVRINRYGGAATLEIREDRRVTAHPMQGSGDLQRLTIYDVSQAFELRARTPFVTTGWRHIAVFDPPAPLRIALDTTPPPYSGRAPQHRDDFGDLELLEGEALHIQCDMPAGQMWRQIGEVPTAAPAKSQLHLEFRDADGHQALSPAFTVTVRPDLPPAIELIEPAADGTCKPGEMPPVHSNVTDDYGLITVTAHYMIDNQEETTQLLWTVPANQRTRQAELVTRLDLGDTTLAPGQFLTGWLEATDNREPDAQRTRSELFFVTIVPDENAFEENMEGMEGGEMHEISVSDLIVEAKRLLRNTFDLTNSPYEPMVAQRLRTELERDLRALELAVRSRSIDLAQQLGMPQLPPQIQLFFNETATHLLQAAADVAVGELEASRAPQQAALVTLTQLNNLLMENMMKMGGGGEGEGQPQPGEENGEDGEDNSASQPRTATADRQQQLAQLEAAREELRSILQEQRALLDDLHRANRLASAYAEPERLLATRTRNVAAKLAGIAEAEPIQPSLRNAMTELDNSGQNFATPGQQATAAIHARRAEKNLQDGLAALEKLLQQLTSRQIEHLGEEAGKLADQQRKLAEKSQKFSDNLPDDDVRKAAREAQEQLANETAELRQRIEQTARSLEADNPKGAKQLRATMTAEDAARLQRAQTRARNAINYRRYETAATEQETAADELDNLAGRLADAATQTGLSPEELQHAIEELQRLADETADGNSAEELAQLAQEAAELANQTGRQLGNDALQAISQELADLDAGGLTPELMRSRLLERLDQARTELRRELANLFDDATRRPPPPATAPPRQYRQEVEEYFRRLAE